MSRCLLCAFCGVWLLLSEVSSPGSAVATTIAPEVSMPLTVAILQPVDTDVFESHRLELGMDSDKAFRFGDEEPSPLFTGASEANPNTSDWDFLWQNASRIPITSIPEPSTGSLLIGGAILLCMRRIRKTTK